MSRDVIANDIIHSTRFLNTRHRLYEALSVLKTFTEHAWQDQGTNFEGVVPDDFYRAYFLLFFVVDHSGSLDDGQKEVFSKNLYKFTRIFEVFNLLFELDGVVTSPELKWAEDMNTFDLQIQRCLKYRECLAVKLALEIETHRAERQPSRAEDARFREMAFGLYEDALRRWGLESKPYLDLAELKEQLNKDRPAGRLLSENSEVLELVEIALANYAEHKPVLDEMPLPEVACARELKLQAFMMAVSLGHYEEEEGERSSSQRTQEVLFQYILAMFEAKVAAEKAEAGPAFPLPFFLLIFQQYFSKHLERRLHTYSYRMFSQRATCVPEEDPLMGSVVVPAGQDPLLFRANELRENFMRFFRGKSLYTQMDRAKKAWEVVRQREMNALAGDQEYNDILRSLMSKT